MLYVYCFERWLRTINEKDMEEIVSDLRQGNTPVLDYRNPQ
jgi:(2Fe-2S) ferredoxin